MKKSLLVLVCLLAFGMAKGQNNEKFTAFARVHDSLMVADYYAKDIKAFKQHFNELMVEFNRLSAKDKEEYGGMIRNDYYNMACTYSLLGDKKNALASLARSEYDDYGHMLEDSDLDPLRDEPAFKKILLTAKNKKSKYLLLLQKEAAYKADGKELPAFTYQSADDPNLVALKKKYNLDSIAGKGSEATRMINLMHWVHNTVVHDGSKGNPDYRNAMNLLTVCTGEGKTCNCRGLGIILNEVYLAAGFKSRYVTCLPKDTADQDCHVITMVFSKGLNKWVWMDPTFDAYVMDENGDLLGIQEVRERLVHNKPLVLNPEANWNHRNSESKEYYLGYYMAKNLYRIECAANSEYNYEVFNDGKVKSYIELKPVSYRPDQKGMKKRRDTYLSYYTSNDVAFWKAPK